MPRPEKRLRAVGANETVPRRGRPKALKTAVNCSERELLVTMRAKIASEIDNGVPAHTLAPLSRRLLELDKEIRLLDARATEAAESAGHQGDSGWDETAI
jgi:hypothetical protein